MYFLLRRKFSLKLTFLDILVDTCCLWGCWQMLPPRPWAPPKQSRRLPLLSHFNSNPYMLRSCCQECFPWSVQWRLPLREEYGWKWWTSLARLMTGTVPLHFTSVVCLEVLAYQCVFSHRWGSACPCFPLWCSQRALLMSAPLSWGIPLLYPLHTPVTKVYAVVSTHDIKWCTHL